MSFLLVWGDIDPNPKGLRLVDGGEGDGFQFTRRPPTGDCGVVLPLLSSSSAFGGGHTHFLPVPCSRRTAGLNPVLGSSLTVGCLGGQTEETCILDGDCGVGLGVICLSVSF